MRLKGRRSWATILLIIIFISQAFFVIYDHSTDADISSGPGPMDASTSWEDDFSDSGSVDTLMGAHIVSGEVGLLPGETSGLVASVGISCFPGFRYDLLVVDVATPGDSSIRVAVLNATEDSQQVGYVNEPISGFKDLEERDVSLGSISTTAYPEIRLQADLEASGPDQPSLLSWAVRFLPVDEWRDDFIGTGKMDEWKGVNTTSEQISIDLSGKTYPGGDYDAFPPVVFSWLSQPSKLDAIYPNAGNTGYMDPVAVDCTGTLGVAIDDLDRDGDLDLICANSPHGGQDKDSQIYWGSSSGTWGPSGAKNLQTVGAERSATGDFNGDGRVDIIITTLRTSATVDTVVFLDKGDGNYNHVPDIVLTQDDPRNVDTGDLNGDGYDDIVLAEDGTSRAFFGGPSGPDTTPDISFSVGSQCDEVKVRDVDDDGHMDVIFATLKSGKGLVFLGDTNGPDTTPDYSLSLPGTRIYGCGSGDFNGDGYDELVFVGLTSTFRIFKGSAQGWSDSEYHDINPMGLAKVADFYDVDKDGYDDLLVGAGNQFKVFLGGTTWPTTSDISKTLGVTSPPDMAVGVPKGGTPGYMGTFVTQTISRPLDMKWDILHLEGYFPQNTTTSISVLDSGGRPITGFKDLEDRSLDLSSITSDWSIKIKVTIRSEFNYTTPALDNITVKWMDRMSWREEFYGNAKIDRLFNVGISDLQLEDSGSMIEGSQLLFTSIRGDDGYSTTSYAYIDRGGLDYLSAPPIVFKTRGAAAADSGDVDGDGFVDVVFAEYMTGDTTYAFDSPLFMGGPVGWREVPDHRFPTVGATDVVLEDLNRDGNLDVVFAQEQDNLGRVNSTLFWGSSTGWNDTPDMEFLTNQASGVVATDLDDDGLLDLVFSCYRAASPATDSMVFLQERTGFCGTEPSHLLATNGARAVAAGDLDGDSVTDLVFANSLAMGSTEIDSYIYWGKGDGSFEATPAGVPTSGAEDVKIADLDGDMDNDIVFANNLDNTLSYAVDSFIFLNGGSGAFSSSPDVRLPTMGATAVAVANLDKTGWSDLVFACGFDGGSHSTDSFVYLGGSGGWTSSPSIEIPTQGASDVIVDQLVKPGSGGYMSGSITPEDPSETGSFHTFRYSADLGASKTAKVQILDATSFEVLSETSLRAGTHEWSLEDAFKVRDHPSVVVAVIVDGLDLPGEFSLDDLWLNWTHRVRSPPVFLDFAISQQTLLRTHSATLWVNVTDEFDLPKDLVVEVEHALNGSDTWSSYLIRPFLFRNGVWISDVVPMVDAALGAYDFRVRVMDTDSEYSEYLTIPNVLEVLNNLPTAPEVILEPGRPVTTSNLRVELTTSSFDVESNLLTYHYRWFRDGEHVEDLTEEAVPPTYTSKGENWSVEVRAFDGDDESPPAFAWRVIQNANPTPKDDLPDPEFDEDTVDIDWLDLSSAFIDPDGDPLIWTVGSGLQNLSVDIDEITGRVTLTPLPNWNGQEVVTFIASDGELQATQRVTVNVLPVNDVPIIATVNGQPITGDILYFKVDQGGVLVITYSVLDVEGDIIQASVNSTAVQLDEVLGQITFEPGNDAVGTLRFALWVWDAVDTSAKVIMNFVIEIEDINDPMDDPEITNPLPNARYKEGQDFSLVVICDDPDIITGQVLNFTWTSNVSGLLGYGPSLVVNLTTPGAHRITVTVRDPDHEKSVQVDILIEAKEVVGPPEDEDPLPTTDGPNWLMIAGIAIALVVIGAVLFMVLGKRRTEAYEARMDAEMDEEEKKESMKRAHAAIKELADEWEADVAGSGARGKAEAAGWEAEDETYEEIGVGDISEGHLTMEAKVTEQASDDVKKLFAGGAATAATVQTEEEKEALRLENAKRTYQNAIGRLPYGIPSKELADRDWVDLASALATGEKKMVEGGVEVTNIDGRWYHSDAKDTGTFLKEHGAKPKEGPKGSVAPTADKEELLAKLEQRFIMGEISEGSYNELKRKFGGR